jgi:hypothetical protein
VGIAAKTLIDFCDAELADSWSADDHVKYWSSAGHVVVMYQSCAGHVVVKYGSSTGQVAPPRSIPYLFYISPNYRLIQKSILRSIYIIVRSIITCRVCKFPNFFKLRQSLAPKIVDTVAGAA